MKWLWRYEKMCEYTRRLESIIHENRMYDYEEVHMAFIAAKIIHLQASNKLFLIMRSDDINEMTYWMIRYYRSKNIEPKFILSVRENKLKYGKVLEVPIVTIDELNKENTKNGVLIIINRESDNHLPNCNDYRESDYSFCFRARVYLEFVRQRGIDNYYHIIEHEKQYYNILEQLEDEESKETFIEVIRSLIENDIYRQKEYKSEIKYFDEKIYKPLGKDEIWVNCGSCSGDTILHYLSLNREFCRIYAVEINEKWIEHLNDLLNLLPAKTKEKINLYSKAFGGKEDSYNIDGAFKDEKITLINMDIEGAEMMVLEGAQEKIKEDLPVLAIAAYHKPSDLLDIPKLIWEISHDYHIYLRKYRGYAPEALNEYIYYAVPTKRLV